MAVSTGDTQPVGRQAVVQQPDSGSTQNSTSSHEAENDRNVSVPAVVPVKSPRGIYQGVIPRDHTDAVEQTVAFYPDNSYQLEEKYKQGSKDSILVIQGNWSPSDGYIWLYKDQVVRARYKWNGDSLQYYNPSSKKGVSLHELKDANQNTVWRNKKKEGVVLFGLGNEPFWNVELDGKDSVSFRLADWSQPVRMKLDSFSATRDSALYTAKNDSASLKVVVLPQFCSDGMSEFTYSSRVKVEYNGVVYSGCGIPLK